MYLFQLITFFTLFLHSALSTGSNEEETFLGIFDGIF